MATVKPLQAWAWEAAQRRQREQDPSTAEVLQPTFAAMPKPREDKTPPLFDFQRASERGAAFAQRAELQKRELDQRERMMDKDFELDKKRAEFQMQLKAKYAPRKSGGGAGPVTKRVSEYLRLSQAAPPADEQQAKARQARLRMLETELGRLGRSGKSALTDLQAAGFGADKYRTDMSKRAYESQDLQAKQAQRAQEQAARQELDVGKTEVQTLSRLVPKAQGFELPDDKAKREKAEADVRKKLDSLRKAGRTVVMSGGKAYLQTPDGFEEVED